MTILSKKRSLYEMECGVRSWAFCSQRQIQHTALINDELSNSKGLIVTVGHKNISRTLPLLPLTLLVLKCIAGPESLIPVTQVVTEETTPWKLLSDLHTHAETHTNICILTNKGTHEKKMLLVSVFKCYQITKVWTVKTSIVVLTLVLSNSCAGYPSNWCLLPFTNLC